MQEESIGKMTVIKIIQREEFQNEISQLQSTKTKTSSSLRKLDPFLDSQGILRVGGRLKHGDVAYAAKHQIILPYKHHAVKLLVRNYHLRYVHCGKEHLLSLLRQEFWIIKGRSLVKTVINQCVGCQRLRPHHMQAKMANLPIDRIAISTPPFFYTGLDYFGPILVKILRSRVKRWGCIFTCLTTRAVHLEVAPTLTTDDFLNVLERFVNRRGNPHVIRSDCGTNFKGAKSELHNQIREFDRIKIDAFSRRREIQWKFNTPNAPHMGGAWERLIRSIKTSLKVILTEQIVNDYVLLTVFTEIESLINSRPLTYVSDDVNDMEPLTPNHFLIGRASTNLTPCVVYDKDTSSRQRWKQVQAMVNQFWDRWIREYLPKLTTRAKWHGRGATLNEGDLVVMMDEKPMRGKWRLGRIIKTFAGIDGVVRTVEVKTSEGRYIRPLVKLSPIELFEK